MQLKELSESFSEVSHEWVACENGRAGGRENKHGAELIPRIEASQRAAPRIYSRSLMVALTGDFFFVAGEIFPGGVDSLLERNRMGACSISSRFREESDGILRPVSFLARMGPMLASGGGAAISVISIGDGNFGGMR